MIAATISSYGINRITVELIVITHEHSETCINCVKDVVVDCVARPLVYL